MTFHELQQLLDYHYWARDRILDAAEKLPAADLTRDLGSSFGSVRDTLVHIYSAEWIWCARWRGHSPTSMLDGNAFVDVAALRNAWRELEITVRAVVDGFGRDGLDRVVE